MRRVVIHIYLLTCTDCVFQYVGESITPFSKGTRIHRKGKSDAKCLFCEMYI